MRFSSSNVNLVFILFILQKLNSDQFNYFDIVRNVFFTPAKATKVKNKSSEKSCFRANIEK